MESGPLIQYGLGSNEATVSFDNFFANSQPDARAAVVAFAVQPLKDFKNTVAESGIEANSIVGDSEMVGLRPE